MSNLSPAAFPRLLRDGEAAIVMMAAVYFAQWIILT